MNTSEIISRARQARKPEDYNASARAILSALYRKSASNYRKAMRVHALLWRQARLKVERVIHLADARECRRNARRCELHARHIEAGWLV